MSKIQFERSDDVRDQLSAYENAERAGFKVVDSEITRFERLDRFESMLDYPVEVWRIEYRWKPDDIHNAGAGLFL